MDEMTNDDIVREYANYIRSTLHKHRATIRHHVVGENQHFWLVSKGKCSAHGRTPSEALEKFEHKLSAGR